MYIETNEDNRVVMSAETKYIGMVEVTPPEEFEVEHQFDWKYFNGEWTYDPVVQPEPTPSWQDRIEAQTFYTAVMTDTLIDEEMM